MPGLLLSGILADQTSFFNKGENHSHPAQAKAAQSNPNSGFFATVYASTDGTKLLSIDEKGHGNYTAHNQNRPVSLERKGSLVTASFKEDLQTFRTTKHGIIDNENSLLYKTGVPELETAAQLRSIANNLNDYYHKTGHYPCSQAQLASISEQVRFKNPLNNGYFYPRLMSVIEKRSANSMTLEEYSYANQFTARLVAETNSYGEPCSVEIYACPLSDNGETLVIRGYDSNGKLLPSSHAGQCYAIVLNQGYIHS